MTDTDRVKWLGRIGVWSSWLLAAIFCSLFTGSPDWKLWVVVSSVAMLHGAGGYFSGYAACAKNCDRMSE